MLYMSGLFKGATHANLIYVFRGAEAFTEKMQGAIVCTACTRDYARLSRANGRAARGSNEHQFSFLGVFLVHDNSLARKLLPYTTGI